MTMNAGEAARQRQQTKAFLAWCNSHLKKRGTALEDFVGDLASGIKLILLVEQLSGDKLGKYNKNPKIRIEKVENLNVALNYINSFLKEIGIKNQYSAEMILDEEERMILGMVWTLILRYSVSEVSEGAQTAKEGLLLWAQKKVQEVDPGRQVANFTTHWQDGCALSALIAGARPDLLDYSIVKPNEKLENLNRVFDLAEEKLGIPKLLDANDMVTPALAPRHSARAIRRARTSAGNSAAQFAPTCPDAAPRPLPQVTMRPDEKSVMAYVAFFWKEFAANKRKNLAAERIGTVVAREQSFLQLQEQYTAQATELSQWLQEREAFFKKEAEGNSMGEVEKARTPHARLEYTPGAATSHLPSPPLLTAPRLPPYFPLCRRCSTTSSTARPRSRGATSSSSTSRRSRRRSTRASPPSTGRTPPPTSSASPRSSGGGRRCGWPSARTRTSSRESSSRSRRSSSSSSSSRARRSSSRSGWSRRRSGCR